MTHLIKYVSFYSDKVLTSAPDGTKLSASQLGRSSLWNLFGKRTCGPQGCSERCARYIPCPLEELNTGSSVFNWYTY